MFNLAIAGLFYAALCLVLFLVLHRSGYMGNVKVELPGTLTFLWKSVAAFFKTKRN